MSLCGVTINLFAQDDKLRKCRDIILLTKVHIVKVVFFPVVMYGYGSRIIKNAEELMPFTCGAGEVS